MKKVLMAATAFTVAGCAIHQNVSPVTALQGTEVCVVENPAVLYDFLGALERALVARGYTVRKLPQGAALRECPVTTTYTANWRWDLAMYMAYAEIRVFKDGAPAGQAVYDALGGGGNMGKFIAAEDKIRELVNGLLPPAPR